MKAEYFVVVFFLLFVGAYFTYSKRAGNWGMGVSTIEINDLNNHEEIKYSGKIDFTPEENGFKSISPGGFIDYSMNEKRMLAKSDKQGLISYELYEGNAKMAMDSNGQKIISDAVKELIAYGVDAGERMERLSKKGGNRALINELSSLKNDDVKRMYFAHILRSDSLSENDLAELVNKVSTCLNSDQDKEDVLKKFNVARLRDSATVKAYLKTVGSFSDDNAKAKALKDILPLPFAHQFFPEMMLQLNAMPDENERSGLLDAVIEKSQLDDNQMDMVIESTGHFNDESQKENVLMQLLKKDSLIAKHFDKLLEQVNHFRDENQKQQLCEKLMRPTLSEDQWISLVNQAASINGDYERTNFLVQLWQKMPRTDNLKAAYLKNAKSISDDSQYGRAVRLVE